MTWKLTGRSMEFCSCTLMCPCWVSPEVKPDQGWCSGALVFDIASGSADGVDLSGTTVVLAADWPGNFFGGQGTGRVYLDRKASAPQRQALEGIFTGNKGGHLAGLFGAVIAKWLPAETTDITVKWSGNPSVQVGSVGNATLSPLKDPNGRSTHVSGAAAQAGFQLDGMDLAHAKGSRWTDPGMRAWEADSGTLHKFDWAA